MGNNPWRTLNSAIRGSLSRLLKDTAQWLFKKKQFKDWFDTYHKRSKQAWISEPIKMRSVYPGWYFNHELTPVKRNSLLCVHAKLAHEGILQHVQAVTWVGDTGNILIKPAGTPKSFHNYLLKNGYGDWWFAGSRSNVDWGVRSRLQGCELHFLKPTDKEVIDAHIDINNPGDPSKDKVTGALSELGDAINHLLEDSCDRTNTHQPHKVREALLKQKILVPLTK